MTGAFPRLAHKVPVMQANKEQDTLLTCQTSCLVIAH